ANKGEICSAGSRLLIHRDVQDAFVQKLVEKAAAMKVGDPLDPASEMGAVASKAQLTKIEGYVALGQEEGAKLLTGGRRLTDLGKGYFYAPTIFDGVRPEMRIAQEEIFGPVLCVLTFDNEDEAVRLANSTVFGLVSSVWTKDSARAHRLARRIKAGSVWLNLWNGFDSASPFGGYKQSGFGREMGMHALESYTQVKSVWVSCQ
ncbi:MAG: aldehyde dehydrogenase family protein, partial [Armatimonadetes bacterium]|nr:aldehyde dehydrogenase family protein [Armatimonadota bacterium]